MTIRVALRDLKNAVLDLQMADHQTFQRPLKRIWTILSGSDLGEFSDRLLDGIDLEAFIKDANSGGAMVGSASLNWPDNSEKELGLSIAILKKAAEEPKWFTWLAYEFYYGGRKYDQSIRKAISLMIIPFERDYANYVKDQKPKMDGKSGPDLDLNRVFIVHGHDEAPREKVARFISELGMTPIILHEQANKGMTIPQKLDANANVGFAVILLTPDDIGRSKAEEAEQPRARQNVILELGYFTGHLGRERVMVLKKDTVEIPTDILGVVWEKFDDGNAWKMALGRELKAAGYDIDWNKIME